MAGTGCEGRRTTGRRTGVSVRPAGDTRRQRDAGVDQRSCAAPRPGSNAPDAEPARCHKRLMTPKVAESMKEAVPKIALSQNYKWYVVGMLWFCGFFNYADRQAIFSIFPLLQRTLHLDKVQLGLLGSSFALVYGICAPFAGAIVDRIRRKSAVLGGLWAWSLICMATAAATNFKQLLFFRAAEGLGETFYFPASMSLISDYHGKRTRSRAMGTHQTSVYIGTIAGGFFGGLISQFYGWRWSFIVFGGMGILLGFGLARMLVESERGAADLEDFGVRKHTEHRMSALEFLKVI